MSTKKPRMKKRAVAAKNQPQLPLRFSDIRLVDCKARQAISDSIPTNSAIHVQVEVGERSDKQEPHFIARPTVTFSAWYDGTSKDDPAVFVAVTFQLMYDVSGPDDAAAKKKFLPVMTQLCMLHSWPYFREVMQSLISRMGLPPILLPLLATPPLKKSTRKARKST
ncbi:MAG: hypothetical protein WD063_00390 [Pirellulales bacterium]